MAPLPYLAVAMHSRVHTLSDSVLSEALQGVHCCCVFLLSGSGDHHVVCWTSVSTEPGQVTE